MKKVYAIIFLGLFFVSSPLLSQGSGELKKAIEQALAEEGLTGAVWSLVDADEKIQVDATGLFNTETKRLLKPTNRVHIGSITKTVLAVEILRLATEGKLNLDHPIIMYVTELSFHNEWQNTSPITIRHLSDHTSGLFDLRLWHFFSQNGHQESPLETAFTKNFSLETFYRRFCNHKRQNTKYRCYS